MSGAGVISKSTMIPPLPERVTKFGDTLQAIGKSPIQRTCSDFSNNSLESKISSTGNRIINAESGITSIIGNSYRLSNSISLVRSTLLD